MSKDQILGILLLIGGILGILVYGWLVLISSWSLLILQLTGFVAVAGVLAIVAWIGYTLATTPAPQPIEDLEKEISQEKTESSKE